MKTPDEIIKDFEFDLETQLFNEWLNGNDLDDEPSPNYPDPMTIAKARMEER
ncbi:MAG: hypothetical protein H8E34_11480 [Bacteroidetes bacterium]|nr:hypothetical protein [Bacteroidota bacterium]